MSTKGLRGAAIDALNVLGIAWVSIHAFLMIVTPALNIAPFLIGAVPYFLGTLALVRGATRPGLALTLAGMLLMAGSDLYMATAYPRASYPVPAPTAR
jgi:hypothetical protein